MAKRTKPRPLTAKQEKFTKEYQVDLNATQAAIRAGYAAHSINAFRVIGCTNLMKVNVKAEIQRLKAKTSERIEITADDVVNSFIDLSERAKLKADLGNENRALENIGKHLGVFEADNSQKGTKAITIINFNQAEKALPEGQ